MEKKLTVKKQGEVDVLMEQDVLDESIITVGNNPSATLELNDSSIAPEQFVIISENKNILLMNRADGTMINGEVLDLGSKVELENGDNIEIGGFEIYFSEGDVNGNGEVLTEVVTSEYAEADKEEKNAIIKIDEDASPGKDFSKVLSNLKEEDSFYFQIINQEKIIERVVFDSESIWLGTSFAECAIKKEKSELDEIYAYVKKDWSGAVIYPEDSEEILLNGEKLKEPNRLKNEDELILIDDFAEDDEIPTKISFHEPVVLLALNSILPEELPEPISLKSEEPNMPSVEDGNSQTTDNRQTSAAPSKDLKVNKKKRKVFGYFSFMEILIMAFGTLVTAAIIFLVLEFV